MAKDHLNSTPRRSQRQQNQPLRIPSHRKVNLSSSQTDTWCGPPTRVRPAEKQDFIDDEDFNEENLAEIRFHDSLSRHRHTKRVIRTYGKKSKRLDVVNHEPEPDEIFKIGDTVLVASDTKEPSIAVVTSMWEIHYTDNLQKDHASCMKVLVHWFLRPGQLARNRKQRDHYRNEIYYSLCSSAVVSPSEILDHCIVTSNKPKSCETKSTHAWSVSPSKRSKFRELDESEDEIAEDDGFYCQLAIDTQRGLFYKFQWESHRDAHISASAEDGSKWDVAVETFRNSDTPSRARKPAQQSFPRERSGDGDDSDSTSNPSSPSGNRKRTILTTTVSPRKRSKLQSVKHDEYKPQENSDTESKDSPSPSSSSEASIDPTDDEVIKTPSRKRGRPTASATATPRRKRIQNFAAPTPHSKAALRSRKRNKTSPARPPPPELGLEYYKQLQRLPPNPWLRAMHVLHVAARPDALPCREEEYGRVLRSVEELVEEGSGGCVYISGVPGTGKTATVHAVVRELKRMAQSNETSPFNYVEINGLKIPSPHVAYNLLWEVISGHDVSTDGHLTISSKEALKRLTKHFSGGASAGPGGHACVVLMDELDQLMTTKQDVVYNFFNWPTLVGSKLIVLAVANTMDLPERVMSGRVRSRLGMIRINFQPYTTAQLEKIVQTRLASAKEGLGDKTRDVINADGVKFASMKVSSISGDARRVLDICRRTVELVQARSKTAKTEDVKEVIKVMQNSPTAAYIRECSLHERIMLAAVLRCVRKEGVEEVKWGDVQHQHVIYSNILTGDDDASRKPTFGELNFVLDSLLASRAMLMEEGLIAQRKPEGERRVMLNLEQNEIERVLGDLGGQRWKNALGV